MKITEATQRRLARAMASAHSKPVSRIDYWIELHPLGPYFVVRWISRGEWHQTREFLTERNVETYLGGQVADGLRAAR